MLAHQLTSRLSLSLPSVARHSSLKMAVSSYMTRSKVVMEDREKYVKMAIDEKRKLYKCGKNFTTLKDVPTWPEYAKAHGLGGGGGSGGGSGGGGNYECSREVNKRVSVWRGDITVLEVDAIVNAPNPGLAGGGGVDGAIHSAAGPALLQAECALLGGCPTGGARLTGGYRLPATYVLHAVGPRGERAGELASCYTTCLDLCREHDLHTVAFPCISTGIYGYPNHKAARVALGAVRQWLGRDQGGSVGRVVFCLFLPVDIDLYHDLMPTYFPLT